MYAPLNCIEGFPVDVVSILLQVKMFLASPFHLEKVFYGTEVLWLSVATWQWGNIPL